jgi:RNA polymerase sigma-70 factor (ECF subfamily)
VPAGHEPSPNAPKPQSGTSLTLLQRLRANEPDAWRTMVHLYTPLLYHWCAQAEVKGADADDVLQEVFRAAATHMEGFRRDRPGDTFRGWLRTITKNMILLHFRRSDRQLRGRGGSEAFTEILEVSAPVDELLDDDEEKSETDGLCRRALELVRGEFEERTWQMFWLTFIDERSSVDIAAELGVTPAAVRKAKSRVLRRLKEEFVDLIQ